MPPKGRKTCNLLTGRWRQDRKKTTVGFAVMKRIVQRTVVFFPGIERNEETQT